MSEYSHATERTLFRMGLPFCRGETRMELGPDRDGSAWGFGCWTLGALLGAGGFDASERAGCAAFAGTAEAEPPGRGLLPSMVIKDERCTH